MIAPLTERLRFRRTVSVNALTDTVNERSAAGPPTHVTQRQP